MVCTFVDVPAVPGQSGSPRVRLAFGPPAQWLVARRLDDVVAVLDAAHDHACQGRWCVGWVAYEAAPAFDPAFAAGTHVHAAQPGAVLAAFAVLDSTMPWPTELGRADRWSTEPWRSDVLDVGGDAVTPRFATHMDVIRARIARGDFYQVNLTTALAGRLHGDDLAYFLALHRAQSDGYAFRLCHALDGVPERILSVSPELFFHWTGDMIRTQPMKGTARRGATPESDAAAALTLRTSAKERAENLMIVDLLRNDLSRIAALGSVRVPTLFELHALPTVWQMTSTVEAAPRPGLKLSEVFAALFPCGSVTGAPKRSAMACIRALEARPRGVYCGAVGLIRPGGEALFNVPIRTVTLRAEARRVGEMTWRARCGVGSGITFDSQPAAEAREWHHKQGFLRRAAAPFELLETLRLEDGRYWLLDGHLARLVRSAAHFGYPVDRVQVVAALCDHARLHAAGTHRVRLRVTERGERFVESSELAPTPGSVRLAWADRPMPAADEFTAHKTTRREAYAPFQPRAGSECFDTLLWNAQGRLTETTFGNVALRIDGQWRTPALAAGLLPGVYRDVLLAEGRVAEADLRVGDMARADGAAFFNSVRGWLEVDWPALQASWRAAMDS